MGNPGLHDVGLWLGLNRFPKSHNIGKAIDRAAGAERKVVGVKIRGDVDKAKHSGVTMAAAHANRNNKAIFGYGTEQITAPATDSAQTWDGWGTALKPAHEIIVCAEKPLDLRGLCGIMAQKIGDSLCQLRAYVKDVAPGSTSSPVEQGVVLPDSVQWPAVEKCNTLAALCEVMDTWPSELAMPTSLSIAWSWLNTLAAVCSQAKMFTTETTTELTTALRTLNSTPSAITPESIIQAATGLHGTGSNASLAVSTFSAVAAKLACIHARSVLATVTEREPGTCQDETGLGLRPEYEPIVVAMKPLSGTFAANALEHGVAGLWIDGGRIAGEPWKWGTQTDIRGGGYGSKRPSNGDVLAKNVEGGHQGRWPANFILSHHEDCRRIGVKKVKGHKGYPNGPKGIWSKAYQQTSKIAKDWNHASTKTENEPWAGHAGPDGTETVPAYDCHPDCPVAMLDGQSGVSGSATARLAKRQRNKGWCNASPGDGVEALDNYGDTGGASRFFYCAKAPKRERWVLLTCDCDDVRISEWQKPDPNPNGPTATTSPRAATSEDASAGECDSSTMSSGKPSTGQSQPSTVSITSTAPGKTIGSKTSCVSATPTTSESTADASRSLGSGGSLVDSVGNTSRLPENTSICHHKDGRCMGVVGPAISLKLWQTSGSEGFVCEQCGKPVRRVGHPTQKPLGVMRYLVKLTRTPTGGTVLDPFMGSGSTGVACVLEGRDFIGIDNDPESVETARLRIAWAENQEKTAEIETPDAEPMFDGF